MNIKLWWENLSERDRTVLMIGGIISAILSITLFIWNPLVNMVENQKSNIVKQQHLLQYLQQSAETMQMLQTGGAHVAQPSTEALLTLVETSLSAQQLSGFLQQVQQPQDNQAALTFEKVPLDKLMQWLQTLWSIHGISVSEFSANRLSVIGTADVTMTVKK